MSAVTAFVLLALSTACFAATAPSELERARFDGEIQRLAASVKTLETTLDREDLRGAIPSLGEALDRSQVASAPELRLYRLRDAFVGIETLTAYAANAGAVSDLASFDTLWTKRRAQFEPMPPVDTTRPQIIVALAESAANRASRLYFASRSYARASGPLDGLYYLAEAEANLRFRTFVELSQGFDHQQQTRPSKAALTIALEDLESLTLRLFDVDQASPTAIPVSVRLKETRELLDQGRLEGATLMLLESRLALSKRTGKPATPGEKPSVQTAADGQALHGTLRSLWVAMAREDTSGASPLVRKDVLPLHDALLLPAPERRRANASVKITLVRWPYT